MRLTVRALTLQAEVTNRSLQPLQLATVQQGNSQSATRMNQLQPRQSCSLPSPILSPQQPQNAQVAAQRQRSRPL